MRAEPEPEFTAYVRARHRELLTSAVLLLGDRPRAEALVRACLVALAARWGSLGSEDPDLWVRRRLHREALGLARRERGAAGSTAAPADLWAAVRSLPPGQRACLLLTRLEGRAPARAAEVLAVPPGRVRADAAAAEQTLGRVLPGLRPGELASDLAELGERLTAAGPAPGGPADAWRAAFAAARRRNRLVVTVVAAVVALAGIAAAVHTASGGEPPAPTAASPTAASPTAPAPPSAGHDGTGTVVRERVEAADGTAYTLVRAGPIAGLATGGPGRGLLPRDLAPPVDVPPLTGVVARAGGRARAVALALRPTPGGFQPLVLVSTGAGAATRWGALDRVLPAPDPVLGTPPAGTRSISVDGSRVGFVGADRAVVLDVATGRLRDVVVPTELAPGPPLTSGAWSDSGAFWVWSTVAAYRLPAGTDALERVATNSRPDRVSLVNAAELRGGSGLDTTLARYDPEGRLTASTEAGGQLELVGSAVATRDWVVRGAYAPRGLGFVNGVVAVRTDGSGERRLLGMDERADGAVLGGLTAAGAVPSVPDVVVLRSVTGGGRTVWVTWDLASDEVRLLATGNVVAVRLSGG